MSEKKIRPRTTEQFLDSRNKITESKTGILIKFWIILDSFSEKKKGMTREASLQSNVNSENEHERYKQEPRYILAQYAAILIVFLAKTHPQNYI